MKNLILIISAICMFLGSVHTAFARPGQCSCSFAKQLLEQKGFNAQSKYSAQDIRQLLASMNIKVCPSCKLPRCSRYCYVCKQHNYLAKNKLIPVNGGDPIVWKNTQPF